MTRPPVLYLGSITTGSGRPLHTPAVQADLARALLSVPTLRPTRNEQRSTERAG